MQGYCWEPGGHCSAEPVSDVSDVQAVSVGQPVMVVQLVSAIQPVSDVRLVSVVWPVSDVQPVIDVWPVSDDFAAQTSVPDRVHVVSD